MQVNTWAGYFYYLKLIELRLGFASIYSIPWTIVNSKQAFLLFQGSYLYSEMVYVSTLLLIFHTIAS